MIAMKRSAMYGTGLVSAGLALAALIGCYDERPATPQPRNPAPTEAPKAEPGSPSPAGGKPSTQPAAESNRVKLETNFGAIVIELDPVKAPESTRNFLAYVDGKHYDGTIFHRVISTFMIQGGGFEPGMKEKPTKEPIKNEARNGLKNKRGTLAMARTNAPHSATSQFFINVVDNGFLDYPGQDGWGYAVFGKVVEGMDVVDKIKAVPTHNVGGHQNVPVDDVIIKSARRM